MILTFHGHDYKDYYLLGCEDVHAGRNLQT
jgi:hypothetical protein